jgi:hypothetical protein
VKVRSINDKTISEELAERVADLVGDLTGRLQSSKTTGAMARGLKKPISRSFATTTIKTRLNFTPKTVS